MLSYHASSERGRTEGLMNVCLSQRIGRLARQIGLLFATLVMAAGASAQTATDAQRQALIAELDAAYRSMPEGELIRVIAEEAPEDYVQLLSQLADIYLASSSTLEAGMAGGLPPMSGPGLIFGLPPEKWSSLK